MATPPLALHRWPEDGPLPQAQQQLLLAAVATPQTRNRDQARQRVRTVLGQVLAAQLACPPQALTLSSAPGRPLRLVPAADNIGLSVSHEPGLSLLAIHLAGPVGIDLLPSDTAPAWSTEIPRLARDYLGPTVAARLAVMPAGEQAGVFAAQWTALEASLKCLGRGLEEWTPILQRELDDCRVYPLQLPPGWVGSVAIPRVPRTI